MRKIIRFYHWIILIWILLVLLFFKVYNNFYFKNNQSILFILMLLIVPIVLTIIKNVIHKKNLKFFYECKNNYFELVEKLINDSMIKELYEITNVKVVDKNIYFGSNYQGVINYNRTYLEIRILNTYVSFKFYYNKTLNETLLFDRTGYQNQDPKVLYNDVILLVKSLINGELTYKELTKKDKICISKLYIDGVLRFSFYLKKHHKDKKYTKNLKIKL